MKLLSNKYLLVLWMLTGIMISCSDDNDGGAYPSVITELVEIHTDSDSLVTEILTDNNTRFTTSQHIRATKPDTLFRCLCVYKQETDNRINIYQLQRIPSSLPQTADNIETDPTAPIKFISAWNSQRYLNISCGILTTGVGSHAFAFCEDSVSEENGLQTAHIRLLHQRPENDAESYTQKLFISLPAFSYTERADSIAFTVNTYNGLRTLGFRFNK